MKILRISNRNLKEVVRELSEVLTKGKVVVCPTDTIYGLVADATNKKAVKKIFEMKKRPEGKPFPVFVKDLNTVKKFAKINKRQEKFLKKVWPGKTTVILKAKKGAKLYTIYKNTIGVRIPDYKLLNILLKRLNRPLAETSVNISGWPPLIDIKKIISQFKNKKSQPDLIIDAGKLSKSKPSTVIDFVGDKFKILRKGVKIYGPKNY